MKNIESEKENLAKIMQGIARHFGDNCEVVLHDFAKDPDHTILAIENGHVTNRRAGGPITSHGLEIIRGVKTPTDQFNYINQSQNGKLLRSTSIYLYDDDDKVIGSICINLDITSLIATRNMLDTLISAQNNSAIHPSDSSEIATNDVNESGKVDINDAQLVFDMYNNEYQDFSNATMLKFLKADVSGDKKIDVNDAVAIVTAILAGK